MKAFLPTAIAFISLSGIAAAAPAPSMMLDVSLSEGGALVAHPKLLVGNDQPAAIVIDHGNGDRYAVNFTLQPQEDGTLLVLMDVQTKSRVSGALSAKPVLKVEPGRNAAVQLGTEGNGLHPLRIDFTVTPSAG